MAVHLSCSRLLRRRRHSLDYMDTIHLLVNPGRTGSDVVELPVPEPHLVEGPVRWKLQRSEARALVVPDIEILYHGETAHLLIGARVHDVFLRGDAAW